MALGSCTFGVGTGTAGVASREEHQSVEHLDHLDVCLEVGAVPFPFPVLAIPLDRGESLGMVRS